MNNTEEKDVPSISIRLEMGKHKKGAPYPEYDFTGIEHIATKSESVATSNQAVRDQIDRGHTNTQTLQKCHISIFSWRSHDNETCKSL